MTEYEKAKAWRESLNLTPEALGKLIGWSALSIRYYEQGKTPKRTYVNRKKREHGIDPKVWTRYKAACAGLDAALKGKPFNWEK